MPVPAPQLREIRSLARLRDWPAVAERLRDVPMEGLLAEPELGFHYADACHRIGEAARAREVAESIESRVLRLGDRGLFLALLNVVGIAHFGSGDMESADARFASLLEYAAAWRNEEFAARAANNLGIIANIRGRSEEALAHFQRALASYTRVGSARGLAQTHHNLGIAYRDLGQLPDAEAHLREALDFATAAESEDVVALAESEMANLKLRGGDPALAGSLATRALQRFERLGDPLGSAEARRVLAIADEASGRLEEALEQLDRALVVASTHREPLLRAEVQRDRGRILAARGERDSALEAYLDAAQQFDSIGTPADAAAARAAGAALGAAPAP
jgi:tetratricopeptide (TPR) repeat protein